MQRKTRVDPIQLDVPFLEPLLGVSSQSVQLAQKAGSLVREASRKPRPPIDKITLLFRAMS